MALTGRTCGMERVLHASIFKYFFSILLYCVCFVLYQRPKNCNINIYYLKIFSHGLEYFLDRCYLGSSTQLIATIPLFITSIPLSHSPLFGYWVKQPFYHPPPISTHIPHHFIITNLFVAIITSTFAFSKLSNGYFIFCFKNR
jgi:hypothetical protein